MAPLAWPLSAVASSSTRLERRDDIWPTPVALHNDAADAPVISIVPAAQDDHAAESEPAVTTVVVAPAPVQPAPPAGGDAEHYLSTYQTPVATVVTTDVFGQLATSTIYAQVTATVTGVAPPPKSTSNADGGAIAGGVIGIILFLVLVYYILGNRPKSADTSSSNDTATQTKTATVTTGVNPPATTGTTPGA